MRKLTLFLSLSGVALLLTVPAPAANKTPTPSTKTKAVATRSVWPPETLSGTISMVDPNRDLVVVKGPDGVPFDMVVTPRTHIKSGDKTLRVRDLTNYQNKNVSLRFVPERRGDVAESIHIAG